MRSKPMTLAALFLCAATMAALLAAVENYELVRERNAAATDNEAMRYQNIYSGKRHTFVKRDMNKIISPEAIKRHTFVKRSDSQNVDGDRMKKTFDKRYTFIKRHTFV